MQRFRVRVRSQHYERLTGEWREVQVSSMDEWTRARESLLQEFRQQFGYLKISRARFGMAPGTVVPRWNDATWAVVSRGLVVDGEPSILKAVGARGY